MAKTITVRVVCTNCKKKVRVAVAPPAKAGKNQHPIPACPVCDKPFVATIDWGSSCSPPDDLVD